MASTEKQIAGLGLMVSELKFELEQLRAEVEELKNREVIAPSMHLITKQVNALEEVIKNSPFIRGLKPEPEPLDPILAKRAFWSITPKQHGIMQLVIMGLTNVKIAKRLDVTEGAVKSYVRHICDSLNVMSRDHLRDTYKPILDEVTSTEYKERTTIIKSWAEKYWVLSYEQAKTDDPYFNAICVMRYRKTKMSEGNTYEAVKIKPEN